MKIAVFPDTCARSGKPVMKAFIESLQGENIIICKNNERPDCDVVVMWSWLLGMYGRDSIYNHYKNKAKFLILEVGGLKRNHAWRIGIGGINRDAEFANEQVDDKRLSLFNLEPYGWHNSEGEYIVICTQNPKSIAWDQSSIEQWCEKQIKWIRTHTDKKILLRPHPRASVNLNKLVSNNVEISVPKFIGEHDHVDLDKLLGRADCVVNYNSNPAIESVLAGIPVYVDESSLCRPVGNAIGSDMIHARPDRSEWCKQISYCEWFVEEIQQGLPWKRLREKL
jgi:hypothetical protein